MPIKKTSKVDLPGIVIPSTCICQYIKDMPVFIIKHNWKNWEWKLYCFILHTGYMLYKWIFSADCNETKWIALCLSHCYFFVSTTIVISDKCTILCRSSMSIFATFAYLRLLYTNCLKYLMIRFKYKTIYHLSFTRCFRNLHAYLFSIHKLYQALNFNSYFGNTRKYSVYLKIRDDFEPRSSFITITSHRRYCLCFPYAYGVCIRVLKKYSTDSIK